MPVNMFQPGYSKLFLFYNAIADLFIHSFFSLNVDSDPQKVANVPQIQKSHLLCSSKISYQLLKSKQAIYGLSEQSES